MKLERCKGLFSDLGTRVVEICEDVGANVGMEGEVDVADAGAESHQRGHGRTVSDQERSPCEVYN